MQLNHHKSNGYWILWLCIFSGDQCLYPVWLMSSWSFSVTYYLFCECYVRYFSSYFLFLGCTDSEDYSKVSAQMLWLVYIKEKKNWFKAWQFNLNWWTTWENLSSFSTDWAHYIVPFTDCTGSQWHRDTVFLNKYHMLRKLNK